MLKKQVLWVTLIFMIAITNATNTDYNLSHETAQQQAERAIKQYEDTIASPLKLGQERFSESLDKIRTLASKIITDAEDKLEDLLKPVQTSFDEIIDRAMKTGKYKDINCTKYLIKYESLKTNELGSVQHCVDLDTSHRVEGIFDNTERFFAYVNQELKQGRKQLKKCQDEECFDFIVRRLENPHFVRREITEHNNIIVHAYVTALSVLNTCAKAHFPGVKEEADLILNDFKQCK